MERKEAIQEMYRITKAECDNNTEIIMDFVKWLHKEKNEAKFLLEMKDLTNFERRMIEDVVNGKLE